MYWFWFLLTGEVTVLYTMSLNIFYWNLNEQILLWRVLFQYYFKEFCFYVSLKGGQKTHNKAYKSYLILYLLILIATVNCNQIVCHRINHMLILIEAGNVHRICWFILIQSVSLHSLLLLRNLPAYLITLVLI